MTDLYTTYRRDFFDDYDHSNDELYVYDQCCQNCRYYNDTGVCCKYDREDYKPFQLSRWCVDWKIKVDEDERICY